MGEESQGFAGGICKSFERGFAKIRGTLGEDSQGFAVDFGKVFAMIPETLGQDSQGFGRTFGEYS